MCVCVCVCVCVVHVCVGGWGRYNKERLQFSREGVNFSQDVTSHFLTAKMIPSTLLRLLVTLHSNECVCDSINNMIVCK